METTDTDSSDRLNSIFRLQAELNDYVFQKNGITDGRAPLTMSAIHNALAAGQLSVNHLPNQWLARYTTAMQAEIDELRDDLHWKWWSKDQIDIQNIRVELVDILHFLVSAMICAGLTAQDVHSLYQKKHALNLARQDAGYSASTKSEDDNRAVK